MNLFGTKPSTSSHKLSVSYKKDTTKGRRPNNWENHSQTSWRGQKPRENQNLKRYQYLKLSVNYYYILHYITLHYITLHYITLHYITLHYITLHYITLLKCRDLMCKRRTGVWTLTVPHCSTSLFYTDAYRNIVQ